MERAATAASFIDINAGSENVVGNGDIEKLISGTLERREDILFGDRSGERPGS
jgi:hypothetical protein